jgi:hypothetical protein
MKRLYVLYPLINLAVTRDPTSKFEEIYVFR